MDQSPLRPGAVGKRMILQLQLSSYMKTTIDGKLHQNLRGAVHLLCQMRCIAQGVVGPHVGR